MAGVGSLRLVLWNTFPMAGFNRHHVEFLVIFLREKIIFKTCNAGILFRQPYGWLKMQMSLGSKLNNAFKLNKILIQWASG